MLSMPLAAFRVLVVVVGLVAAQPAAAIDPVVLLLLRTLRDQIAVSIADSVVSDALKKRESSPRQVPLPPPGLPPPGLPMAEQVRFLIDRNFTYLSSEDRDRVYAAVIQRLDDPANVDHRAHMMSEFANTAFAVGEAQRTMEMLTRGEKQRLAENAAAAVRKLPPAERGSIIGLLETGHVPIPRDLNAMLLREIALR